MLSTRSSRFPRRSSLTAVVCAFVGLVAACSADSSATNSGDGGSSEAGSCEGVAKLAAQGAACCVAHGGEACATDQFCAAYDGKPEPVCYANKSRAKGQSCANDIECEYTCNATTRVCDGPKKKAIVVTRLGDGGHTPVECRLGSNVDWVTFGSFDSLTSIEDGAVVSGKIASVRCTIALANGAYAVNARAGLEGGGSVEISGQFDPVVDGGATAPIQSNVTATFTRGTETYKQTDCVVSYGSAQMGVFPGRFWGTLDCPNVKDATSGQVCNAHALLRFENCEQ